MVVFHGTFDLRAAAAVAHNTRAAAALKAGHPAESAAYARVALALDPDNFDGLCALGQALAAAHDPSGASAALHRALDRTAAMEPSAQTLWRRELRGELLASGMPF